MAREGMVQGTYGPAQIGDEDMLVDLLTDTIADGKLGPCSVSTMEALQVQSRHDWH